MRIKKTIVACLAQLTFIGAAAQISVDEEHFPDNGFRDYVSSEFDKDGDNTLSENEIAVAQRIELNGFISDRPKIESLKGVEFFGELRNLNCSGNNLIELDLRANKQLETVFCSGNKLESINIDGLQELRTLNCAKNHLSGLDVSSASKLTSLNCSKNRLDSLDVSACVDLHTLICSKNSLTEIDVKNNPALKQLSCSANRLSALDVSKNNELVQLACSGNQLTALVLANCPDLQELDCHDNQIANLELKNNTKLTEVYCFRNKLKELDVQQNTELETLSCGTNELTALDVNQNAKLKQLSCGVNKIKTLDTNNNEVLEVLNCNDNELTQIELSANAQLTELQCEGNKMTAVNLSDNDNLKTATTDVQTIERDMVSLPSGAEGILLSEDFDADAISDITIEGAKQDSPGHIEIVDSKKYLVVNLSQQIGKDSIRLSYSYATGNKTASKVVGNKSLQLLVGSTWDGIYEEDKNSNVTKALTDSEKELTVRVEVTVRRTHSAESQAVLFANDSQKDEKQKYRMSKDISIKVCGHSIVVDGTDDYMVYDIIGRKMLPNSLLERGIYIVRIGNTSQSVRVK